MLERTKNWLAFTAGVAAGAALPVVVPAVAEAGRPLAKALIKHGLLGFDRLRVGVARASEAVDDMVAEARAEAAQAQALQPSAAEPPEPAAQPTSTAPAAESQGVRAEAKVLS